MNNLIKVIGLTLVLSACGSDNDTPMTQPTDSPALYTGIFIDSPVQGLTYQTETQAGITNAKGEFNYQLGEQVTFSIGDITFPKVNAIEVVTPLTLFNTEDVNTTAVVNTLRLLQTLDVDAMPENGITLPENAASLANKGNVDFSSDMFDSEITPYLIEINGINQQLISTESAIYHFQQTMGEEPAMGNSCGDDHSMVGYTGSFSSIAHGVSGNATILDNCTIEITDFNYDGGGPLVYFYAAQNQVFEGDDAFQMGDLLTGTQFIDETVIVTIPKNKSLDDFNSISVWCVDFDVDFGNVIFTAP